MEVNLRKYRPLILVFVALFILILSWSSITINIPAGHKGVLFRKFAGGIQKDRPYGEGFHFIAPWNDMFDYEVRQQEVTEKMEMLSSNGLEIKIDVSVWFHPNLDKLGYLHAEIGENYTERIVIPSIRSSARTIIGRYTPEEIYSTKREAIQDGIYKETAKLLTEKNVVLDKVLIRSIMLPPTIKSAIENKLKQEQEDLAYEFLLKKAEKEAKRQRIEAEGKAEANRIISESLTDRILTEKGIQATLELASSQNSKVVVVGSGDKGLPLILGNK